MGQNLGNLKEVHLGNILQALSLNGRTGLLSLRDEGLESKIFLRHGRIAWAQVNESTESSFSWLVQWKVVDQTHLEKALDLSLSVRPPQRIVEILGERFAIDRATIERVGRCNVEGVMSELLGWKQGSLAFKECHPEALPDLLAPGGFLLSEGVLPGSLSKLQDGLSANPECEGLPKFVAGEAEPFTVPPGSVSFGSANSSVPESDGRRIFLIDDDPVMQEQLGKALSALGWETELFARSSDLADKLETCFAQGERPILLIDLIMPRFSGDGILGGLELLQFVRSHYPDLAVIMFSDFFCAETEKRIQDLGVARLLVKPRPDCGTMNADSLMTVFIDEVIRTLPPLASSISVISQRNDEKDCPTDCSATAPTTEENPLRQQLALLENLSSELSSPEPGEQFRLLILRFAAELFDRSIIFSVIDDKLQATGQFGFDAMSGIHGHRLKELKIPLHKSSIFSSVLDRGVPFKVDLSPEAWTQCFCDLLDGPPARQAFLGPVICQEEVEIILYGDTLPDRPAIGETAALEVFLSQVGLVREKERLKAALALFSQRT